MNKMMHILMLFIVCSLSAVQAQHSTMNKQEFRQKQKQFLICLSFRGFFRCCIRAQRLNFILSVAGQLT